MTLDQLRGFVLSVASSALRLVGHMDGFCVDNTANNPPAIPHDTVASVGCRILVDAHEYNEQSR